MSARTDAERREDALEAFASRSREIQRQLQRIATWSYEGMPIAEQARRLGISRDKVYFYRRVLTFSLAKPPPGRRGTLWGEVPPP